MLVLSGKFDNYEQARGEAEASLDDGRALSKFKELVAAQGGDIGVIEDTAKLPSAPEKLEVDAESEGYLHEIHAREVGLTAMELGAGRAKKGDAVDYAVGIEILKNVGDPVERGDLLAVIHAQSEQAAVRAAERLRKAHTIKSAPIDPLPLFYETIGD
jgi:pyrimidine-nucleoside phosphorylase